VGDSTIAPTGVCAAIGAPSAISYRLRMPGRDAPPIAVMRELAGRYPRYRHRRIQVFLERHGHAISSDRTYGCGARQAGRFRRSGLDDASLRAALGRYLRMQIW